MASTEQRPDNASEIGSIAEMTGTGEIPVHDVFDTLVLRERPFTISSVRKNPRRGQEVALVNYYGDQGKYFVWMANNSRRALSDEPIIDGLFRVDRQNRRLLFEPFTTLPSRDSYRATELQLGYTGKLIDMAAILADRGFPIMQISMLQTLEAHGPSGHFKEVVSKVVQARSAFSQLTGLDIAEAYQVEGVLTIDQIMAGQFIPVTPIDPKNEGYLGRLKSNWGVKDT